MKNITSFCFLFFTALFLFYFSFFNGVYAKTYYVSISEGDDTYDGLTMSWSNDIHGPLKHCPGMESYSGTIILEPGDVIVFKKGDTWTDNFIASVPGITYTSDNSYGTGEATIDMGTGENGKNYGISIEASNVKVSDLSFTKGMQIIISDPKCPDTTFRDHPCTTVKNYLNSGLVNSAIVIAPPKITVGLGYMISDFPGCSMGINSSEIAGRLIGVQVDNCRFFDTSLSGVIIRFTENSIISNNTIKCSDLQNCNPHHSFFVSGIYYGSGTEHITITGNDVSGVSGFAAIAGSQAWGFEVSEMSRIPVTPSYVCTDCGRNYYYEYEDYATMFPRNITIEHNRVHDCWSIGIMAVGQYVTVQYNELYNMNKTQSPIFSPPVDGKGGVAGYGNYILGASCFYNSVIRYNKVHDTYLWFNYPDCLGYPWNPCVEGDAIYLEFACWDNQIYGNMVYNNEKCGIHQIVVGRNHFYHNTLYNNGSRSWSATDFVQAPSSSFSNNLFVDNGNPSRDRLAILIDGTSQNYDLSVINNLFYDYSGLTETDKHIAVRDIQWRGKKEYYTLSEFEAYALENPALLRKVTSNRWGNPLFTNPSYTSADCDLRLQDWSPAIDAGMDTPADYTHDILGNPIYGPPDIGAFEYQPQYTMGTDKININAGARVYGDEKFRNLETPGELTADLSVAPDGSDKADWVDIHITEWQTSGNYTRAWTESTGRNIGSTEHVVGGLEKNKYYLVKVNNETGENIIGPKCTNGVSRANKNGQITFTFTGGYSSDKNFTIEAIEKKVAKSLTKAYKPV